MSRDDHFNETEAYPMPSKKCPECSTPVTDDLPGGLCPTCLMDAARKSNPGFNPAPTRSENARIQAPTISTLARLFPELEIMELIGVGGMGAVYKAKQKNLDRLVALKIFLFQPSDARITDRFRQEARALAKFNHQNIVSIHDFGCRDNFHFLLMEFVDGPNLRQIVRTGELAPRDALNLVPQLCDALQYAHEKGIIHRDIKPENVLVLPNGNVKIADFGLAKITNQATELNLTQTQQVLGTYNYMAPEQRERPAEVDHRADIYSLGVVIYELLTGELPLGRFAPPSERATVNKRFDEVVMRALEKEPSKRYQQVSEFKTSIQSIAHFASPTVQPVPPLKSKLPEQNSPTAIDDSHKIQTIPQMFFFAFGMFVCCAGVLCLIMSDDEFFAKEMRHVGGRFFGLMIIMAGSFLLTCQGFMKQILTRRTSLKRKCVAAFGCLAMFIGMSGVSCLIASAHADVFKPIPANARAEADIAAARTAARAAAMAVPIEDRSLATEASSVWELHENSIEDFEERQRDLEKVLQAIGICLCIFCGFLFAVNSAAHKMLKDQEESNV